MSTVIAYLEAHGLAFVAFDHARADRALAEARALGVAPGAIAKTVVLDTPDGHALAVLPASRRLDLKLAGEAIGVRHVKLATEHEIADDLPGYELGAIPPLPGLLGMPLYLDAELATYETIVFAAGWQTESVKMRTSDLIVAENVRVAPLSKAALFDRDPME